MTAVLASISVHIRPFKEPQVGSCVLLALSRSIAIRTTEAAIVKAPRAKIAIKPVLAFWPICSVEIRGIGRR